MANRYAAIWDVDGTLVDTAELHFQAWTALCAEHGRPFTRAEFAATFGQRNPEILPQLFSQRLTEADIAELGEHKEVLYRAAAAERGVKLLPGAQALLEALRAAGWKQAIGSSAPRRNLELILGLTQAERYFDAIVSMEDTSRGKPDPEVFLVAAAKLQVPPSQCVVLEDAVAGVQAARAGGMKCVAVRFVAHHPEEKLRAAGADLIASTLERVSEPILRQLLSN